MCGLFYRKSGNIHVTLTAKYPCNFRCIIWYSPRSVILPKTNAPRVVSRCLCKIVLIANIVTSSNSLILTAQLRDASGGWGGCLVTLLLVFDSAHPPLQRPIPHSPLVDTIKCKTRRYINITRLPFDALQSTPP